MKAPRRSHSPSSPSNASAASSSPYFWPGFRSVLLIVASSSPAACSYSDRGYLKSPWSRRKRKHALSPRQWRSLFPADGKLRNTVELLKKVRNGGVHPSIRAEVWPFLLGVYDLNSSSKEREVVRKYNRMIFEKLRRQCRRLANCSSTITNQSSNEDGECVEEDAGSSSSEDVVTARDYLSSEEKVSDVDYLTDNFVPNTESSSDSVLSDGEEAHVVPSSSSKSMEESEPDGTSIDKAPPFLRSQFPSISSIPENFSSWQRIIRVDALRASSEWIVYSPILAQISAERASSAAVAVRLKNYDHLEPCRVFHAARLVAILEAYALYDSDIGYCQGMSDLLSPIIAVITEDDEAFWCFAGFMRKARHNFRLDEVGIRRQLNMVSNIIKCKDSHLYKHLEKYQVEDCFFVYRMVVVLFRRELSFEQTISLWEVMWADQTAIRAGIGKSAWSKITQRAPPTDDLLLYAIAASVLQRRKLIMEKYSSMEEILREFNNMAGQLDVWKLLDDAHDLVVNLHDKIPSTF